MNLDDEIPELDLNQNFHECAAQMRDLTEIQLRDLMNQDPPTQWALLLSCDVFMNIFPFSSEIV